MLVSFFKIVNIFIFAILLASFTLLNTIPISQNISQVKLEGKEASQNLSEIKTSLHMQHPTEKKLYAENFNKTISHIVERQFNISHQYNPDFKINTSKRKRLIRIAFTHDNLDSDGVDVFKVITLPLYATVDKTIQSTTLNSVHIYTTCINYPEIFCNNRDHTTTQSSTDNEISEQSEHTILVPSQKDNIVGKMPFTPDPSQISPHALQPLGYKSENSRSTSQIHMFTQILCDYFNTTHIGTTYFCSCAVHTARFVPSMGIPKPLRQIKPEQTHHLPALQTSMLNENERISSSTITLSFSEIGSNNHSFPTKELVSTVADFSTTTQHLMLQSLEVVVSSTEDNLILHTPSFLPGYISQFFTTEMTIADTDSTIDETQLQTLSQTWILPDHSSELITDEITSVPISEATSVPTREITSAATNVIMATIEITSVPTTEITSVPTSKVTSEMRPTIGELGPNMTFPQQQTLSDDSSMLTYTEQDLPAINILTTDIEILIPTQPTESSITTMQFPRKQEIVIASQPSVFIQQTPKISEISSKSHTYSETKNILVSSNASLTRGFDQVYNIIHQFGGLNVPSSKANKTVTESMDELDDFMIHIFGKKLSYYKVHGIHETDILNSKIGKSLNETTIKIFLNSIRVILIFYNISSEITSMVTSKITSEMSPTVGELGLNMTLPQQQTLSDDGTLSTDTEQGLVAVNILTTDLETLKPTQATQSLLTAMQIQRKQDMIIASQSSVFTQQTSKISEISSTSHTYSETKDFLVSSNASLARSFDQVYNIIHQFGGLNVPGSIANKTLIENTDELDDFMIRIFGKNLNYYKVHGIQETDILNSKIGKSLNETTIKIFLKALQIILAFYNVSSEMTSVVTSGVSISASKDLLVSSNASLATSFNHVYKIIHQFGGLNVPSSSTNKTVTESMDELNDFMIHIFGKNLNYYKIHGIHETDILNSEIGKSLNETTIKIFLKAFRIILIFYNVSSEVTSQKIITATTDLIMSRNETVGHSFYRVFEIIERYGGPKKPKVTFNTTVTEALNEVNDRAIRIFGKNLSYYKVHGINETDILNSEIGEDLHETTINVFLNAFRIILEYYNVSSEITSVVTSGMNILATKDLLVSSNASLATSFNHVYKIIHQFGGLNVPSSRANKTVTESENELDGFMTHIFGKNLEYYKVHGIHETDILNSKIGKSLDQVAVKLFLNSLQFILRFYNVSSSETYTYDYEHSRIRVTYRPGLKILTFQTMLITYARNSKVTKK